MQLRICSILLFQNRPSTTGSIETKLPTVLPEFHKFRLQYDNNVNIITLKWEHYNDDKASLDLSKLA